MNQTERRMVSAVRNGMNFCAQNTRVKISGNRKYAHVYLFDNHIATIDRESGKRWFNRCGWNTVTTKNRMIALGYDSLHIHNGEIYSSEGWYENGVFTLSDKPNAKCRFVDEDLSVFINLGKSDHEKAVEIERKKNSYDACLKRDMRARRRKADWWSDEYFKVQA